MNNNNHKNCGFGEDAAAYLYNELEKGANVNFETHLAKCDSCADEIAEFTVLRSGIVDWKMKSFDVLTTPVIEVPYEKPAPSVEIRTEKISWFDSLKNALTFSPAFATITAVMILALFGISYLMFISSGEDYTSNGATKNGVVNSPVIADKKSASVIEEDKKSKSLTEENEKSVEPNAPEVAKDNVENNESVPTIIKTKSPEKPQPITVAKETPKKVKPVELKRKSNDVKPMEENFPIQAQQKMPKLNTLPDEEEIVELRLSDLLGDADSE